MNKKESKVEVRVVEEEEKDDFLVVLVLLVVCCCCCCFSTDDVSGIDIHAQSISWYFAFTGKRNLTRMRAIVLRDG